MDSLIKDWLPGYNDMMFKEITSINNELPFKIEEQTKYSKG